MLDGLYHYTYFYNIQKYFPSKTNLHDKEVNGGGQTEGATKNKGELLTPPKPITTS